MNKIIPLFLLASLTATAQQRISLAGQWQFGTGETENYTDKITLPGSMLTNGKGDDVSVRTPWVGSLYDSSFYFNPYMERYRMEGRMKFPFFLTPAKHYVGTAWYRRTASVPKEWRKGRVILHLERPHITTTVYVNGHEAGRDSSLSVPHDFDVTPYISFGRNNEIAIRMDNTIENVCVGQDSHSVTDQTQGDWNGIVGDMALTHRGAAYVASLAIFPTTATGHVTARLRLAGEAKATGGKHTLQLTCKRKDTGETVATATQRFRGDTLTATLQVPKEKVEPWDEFTPNLYELTAMVDGDATAATFGFRDFTIEGRQFYVNGRKTWMRGTVGNCCFPLTGYPPTDVEAWLTIFRKCKEYGLNMMRFHSYCPPEAAFEAADHVGIYLQPEGPSWPNHGVKLRRGMTIDRYLMEETQRMVEAYGNHPSFCMLAAGNEPAGDWVSWVGDFVDAWKATGDTRRTYCGASVGGGWAFDPKSQYHVKGGARGLDWDKRAPQSADDYYAPITSFTQKGNKPVTFKINEPYLSHEQGQWCAFPDLKERSQYTGAYKAANFDIFADLLRDNGMESQAEKFLHASGKLQTLAYKYELERNLRTKDYAGFQLLGLNDYSGQGTALVGVLNVFWREKGYCTAADWTQFCQPVVPLAKLPKFVYANDERLHADVELYNAYKEPLRNARATYHIYNNVGNELAKGQLAAKDMEVGKNIDLGCVDYDLADIKEPTKLTLAVNVEAANAKELTIGNTWDVWVYPKQVAMPQPKDIYITDTLDAKAVATLRKGGKVLIEAAGKVTLGSDVKQTYLPVFWNTSWFKMRPPHTTGATIDTRHPLFRGFPTDDWGNLNWWELLNRSQVMNLRELPAGYQSPIQPIDTWHVSRKLGMLIEANVLGGKVLMTTMDISSDLDRRLVARQMRKAILEYMAGEAFSPTLSLSEGQVADFFTKQAPPVDMYTNDSPDELKPKLK